MSYLGINSTSGDPDGWVICDGKPRNCTDNRYQYVYSLLNTALGVSTNNANNITPPNLQNVFLYGAPSSDSEQITIGGNSDVSLSTDNLPSHSHTINISDPGHNHSIYISNTSGGSSPNYWGWSSVGTGLTPDELSGAGFLPSTTGITATSDYTGGSTSFSILPPYVGMSYIMKY